MTSPTNLELDLDGDRLSSGETLSGRLRPTSGQITTVQLRIGWQRRIDGAEDRREVVLEERLSPDGEGGFSFDVDLPNGPCTFDDSTAALDWEIEAVGLTETDEEIASVTRGFTLTPGDPRERSGSESALDLPGASGNAWINDMLESLFSAFGHPTSHEELHERLAYIDTGTGPYERRNSLAGNLVQILLLLGMGLAFIVAAPRLFEAGSPALIWIMRAVGAGLVGWGGWILYKAVRNQMAEAAVGEVAVEVHPDQMIRGDSLTSTLAFSPERDIDLNHIDLTLECRRIEKTKGSKHRRRHHHHHDDDDGRRYRTRTYTETLHSEELRICEEQSVATGERHAFAEQFTIPETVRHSYFHRAPFWVRWLPLRGLTLSLEVKWVVEVHIDIDDWPDWVTEYQCVVYP